MVGLLTWTISAFALSWAAADAKISLPFRTFLEAGADAKALGAGVLLMLVECVACSGFWVGLIGQLVGIAPFSNCVSAGFFTCGSNLLIAKWLGMLDPD